MLPKSFRALTLMATAITLSACGGDSSDGGGGVVVTGIGGPAGGCDRYVDASAGGADDGSSWTDAWNHLQDALDEASATPGTDFAVCVATGIYRPDEDRDGDHTDNDVQESFTFTEDNVGIYGGYPAGGGKRRPQANPTVLSGDIDENDTANADGLVISNSDVSGGNSQHVIEMIGDDGTPITTNTRIDGVYVTAGDNRFGSGGELAGGGLLCDVSSGSCSPRLVRVVFQGNRAYSGGGAYFSASNSATVSPEFINVQLRRNYSDNTGAGVAFGMGGSSSGAPKFINTLFDGNESDEGFRGGTYSTSTLQPTFVNSVFVNNPEAIYNYEATGTTNEPLFVNSIVWDNTSGITDNGATSTINNSIINGGWGGAGSNNLDQDPTFVNTTGSDGIPGTLDDDLRLQSGSPAIDAGDQQQLLADLADLDADGDTSEDTPQDLFGNARVRNGEADIGVHER